MNDPGKLQSAVFRASLIFKARFQDDDVSSIAWQCTIITGCTMSYMLTYIQTILYENKSNKFDHYNLFRCILCLCVMSNYLVIYIYIYNVDYVQEIKKLTYLCKCHTMYINYEIYYQSLWTARKLNTHENGLLPCRTRKLFSVAPS